MKNCLRKIRREHDESQEALAKAVGTTRQTIIGIEREHIKRPSDELMTAIAKHYKKSVGEIFFSPFVRQILQDSHNVLQK